MHRLVSCVSCRRTYSTQAQQRCHNDEFAPGTRVGAASARHSLLFFYAPTKRDYTDVAKPQTHAAGRACSYFLVGSVCSSASVESFSTDASIFDHALSRISCTRRRRQGCNEVGRKHLASHLGPAATELMILGKTKRLLILTEVLFVMGDEEKKSACTHLMLRHGLQKSLGLARSAVTLSRFAQSAGSQLFHFTEFAINTPAGSASHAKKQI